MAFLRIYISLSAILSSERFDNGVYKQLLHQTSAGRLRVGPRVSGAIKVNLPGGKKGLV